MADAEFDRAVGNAGQEAKRVLIVCQLDGYANSPKPVQVQRFLKERGHEVELVNTYYLSRASSAPNSSRNKLPRLEPRLVALYAIEAASAIFTRRWQFGRRRLSYYVLVADYRLRRRILRSSLPLDRFDLIICETPHDAGVLTAAGGTRTLYDCPTPWADEIYLEGRLTKRQHEKLRRLETELWESVDYLAFHWESYAPYAIEHYGISGRNLMTLNYGCTPSAQRAQFANPPRIVYMGSLGGRAVDVPQLARLAELYPHIDVYGGPPPPSSLGLNYLGYASPDVLRDYQLGLITSTKDGLRREGFSAKHPQYLAYGLPVLIPAWRRHMSSMRGSVAYDENTFLAVVDALSDENEWRRVSDEAYTEAQRLTWDETLRPLETVLDD